MEYSREVIEAAARLNIRASAVQTYLDAGRGERATGVERRFHATIKPIGSTCNLDCHYCYYRNKGPLLEQTAGWLSEDILEQFIVQYVASQDVEDIAFTWHGGEPSLLGVGFFRRVAELQRIHTPRGRRISNDLQTNGTLLDDEWCRFLADNEFLVGLSVDGPGELHDGYRRSKAGGCSGAEALLAAERLARHEIPFATLTTVHRQNARQPREVYRFLRDSVGARYLQFIPCVEPRQFERTPARALPCSELVEPTSPRVRPGHPDSVVTDFTVDPDDWGSFLSGMFDEWYQHDRGRVKINLFESLLAQGRGAPPITCSSGPICGKNVVLEADGRVYSCDHFVYPEFELGSIRRRTLGEMVFSLQQLEFGLAKFNDRASECQTCRYFALCGGECPRTRILKSSSGHGRLSYLCAGWKQFYSHALPRMARLAES